MIEWIYISEERNIALKDMKAAMYVMSHKNTPKSAERKAHHEFN